MLSSLIDSRLRGNDGISSIKDSRLRGNDEVLSTKDSRLHGNDGITGFEAKVGAIIFTPGNSVLLW